ncbi:MAG: aminopeptidase N, partial [Geminicoccaceae bacterium]|nr:aminopeptidase N [Geminicoccaceae bacterium]
MTAGRDPVRLADYRSPAFTTRSVDMDFLLDPERTLVTTQMRVERRRAGEPLRLLGDGPELVSLLLDGRDHERWRMDGPDLLVDVEADSFELTLVTRIRPRENTALSGLYVSNDVFCTQCEAEGFRRITFFQDRPDVLATYRVRLEADAARYPVLLSNGNLLETGRIDGGRHFALWEDPFPKPSYLFAVVAGDLALLEDRFVTMSGRTVALRIWSEHACIDQCGHAMESLKKSMRWDEERYGLEYDLDLFQIVAVSDFNMGAME